MLRYNCMVLFDILVESLNQRLGQTAHFLREDFPKKLVFFWMLSKLPPPPHPNLDNLHNFV